MTNPQGNVIGLRTGEGMPVTLTAAREWLQNSASTLAEQQAGHRFVTAYELQLKGQRDTRLADGINRSTETATRLGTSAHEATRDLIGAIGAPHELGSVGIRDLLANVRPLLAELEREIPGFARDFAEREQLRGMDLTDFQAEQLRHLPAMRRLLPNLLGEVNNPHGAPRVPEDRDFSAALAAQANALKKLLGQLVDELEL